MVIDNGSIFILLHIDIQLCQHHLLNMLSFFHFIFLACQKSGVCMCVDCYPGLLFGSIGPPVCFYANTRLFSVL